MSQEAPTDPPKVPEKTSDLWHFYEEHAAQARQHETLRAAVTTLLTGFAAIIIASATSDGFKRHDILDGAVIVAIGVVGALLSLKHYEHNRFHTNVLKRTRDQITQVREAQALKSHVESIDKALRKDNEPRLTTFSRLRKQAKHDEGLVEPIPAFWLWLALPMVIVVAGLVIVGLSV